MKAIIKEVNGLYISYEVNLNISNDEIELNVAVKDIDDSTFNEIMKLNAGDTITLSDTRRNKLIEKIEKELELNIPYIIHDNLKYK